MKQLGTYTSRIDRDEAMKMLQRWRSLRRGKLTAVTEISLPYHVFSVTFPRRGKALLAVDAIDGRLDLHRLEHLPLGLHPPTSGDPKCVAARLSVDLAVERVVDQALRMLFLDGFFKQHEGAIETEHLGISYLPYWIGFFERRDRVQIEVIDAYRGRFEGEKMRQVVATILSSRASTSSQMRAAAAGQDRSN